MSKKLIASITLLIIVAVGTQLTRHFGWYSTYWFTDVILHTLSGMMFALLWASLTERRIDSRWVLFITCITFAVFGSVLWECWEYWGYLLKPDFARFYIPDIADSLGDIMSGALGAVLIYPFIKNKFGIIK